MRLKSHILLSISLSVLALSSCKKEVELNTNGSLKTFDANYPVDCSMNENGLLFRDVTAEQSTLDQYETIFGFSTVGNQVFKTRKKVDEYISNSTSYSSVEILGLENGIKLHLLGSKTSSDSVYVFVNELDAADGSMISEKSFSISDDIATVVSNIWLEETPYGYALASVSKNGNFHELQVKRLDNNLNELSSGESIIGTGDIVYNDLTVSPITDEIVICYIRLATATTPFTIRAFNPDVTPKWLNAYEAELFLNGAENPSNTSRRLFIEDDQIRFFTYGSFSTSVAGSQVNSSDPAFYSINLSDGITSSYSLIASPFSDLTTPSIENLRSVTRTEQGEYILSGFVQNNEDLQSGALVHLDDNLQVLNSFHISEEAPRSTLLFATINSSGQYIVAGQTPRFLPGFGISPASTTNPIAVFVANLDINGNINP